LVILKVANKTMIQLTLFTIQKVERLNKLVGMLQILNNKDIRKRRFVGGDNL